MYIGKNESMTEGFRGCISQVSFDDSENADPKSISVISVEEVPPAQSERRRPKRGSRVSRNMKPPAAVIQKDQLKPEPLSPLAENDMMKTPVNNRAGKKKLFTETPGAEMFTPPDIRPQPSPAASPGTPMAKSSHWNLIGLLSPSKLPLASA